MTSGIDPAPTARQLRYLRLLADRSATTFAYPSTRRAASAQIERLRRLEREPREHAWRDGDLAEESLCYATALDPSEVLGFGSSSRWRVAAPAPLPPSSPHPRERQLGELARYTLSGCQRVLCARHVEGRLTLVDRSASPAGPTYVVEPDLQDDDGPALDALIADYLQRAEELDEIPMASGALRRLLGQADRGA